MKPRKWSTDQLHHVVKNSSTLREVIKKLGLIPAGGNYHQVQRYIKEQKIDTSHFKGKAWRKGSSTPVVQAKKLSDILKKSSSYPSHKLKQRLWREDRLPKSCQLCGWAEISKDGRLPLELDHINGDRTDNRIENLRILCPNCHSLQPTHRGRNQKRKNQTQ